MTTRLQVLLENDEIDAIRVVAKRHRLTVAEWVRQALRKAREDEPPIAPSRKLSVVREATRHSYPTSDVQQMLTEIEGAYRVDLPE